MGGGRVKGEVRETGKLYIDELRSSPGDVIPLLPLLHVPRTRRIILTSSHLSGAAAISLTKALMIRQALGWSTWRSVKQVREVMMTRGVPHLTGPCFTHSHLSRPRCAVL